MEPSGPSSLDPQASAHPAPPPALPIPATGEGPKASAETAASGVGAPSTNGHVPHAVPVFQPEVLPSESIATQNAEAGEPPPPTPPHRRRAETSEQPQRSGPRWMRPLVFLLLSLVSMFLAWHWSSWKWTFPDRTGRPELWSDGAVYTLALFSMLAFHEFGHFLQAVRYRMDVSWPYMIPMPPPLNPFGTLGAVIVSVQGYRNRKELFDVGVTGPLAGLVVAVPLFAWGIATAKPVEGTPFFGEMVGMRLLVEWFHGPLPTGWTLAFNPAATAGWVGLFLTGLNLIPVGQLDGGHVAYALLGKRAAWIGYAALACWIGMMVWRSEYQLSLMLLLVLLTGVQHPPTLEDHVPLGWGRTVVGWISLLLPILCLTLAPLNLG